MNCTEEKINLFFKDGRSDKVYNCQLTQSESGWAVTAQWGRAGSTLSDDTKLQGASYENAKKLYDKVTREKLAKGYRVTHGTAAELTRQAPASKEIVFSAELLTRITDVEAKAYVTNPRYYFQPKRDGVRLTICVRTKQQALGNLLDIFGYNKLGQRVELDAKLTAAVYALCVAGKISRLILDGEWESTGYYAWDLLELNSDQRDFPYRARLETLEVLLSDLEPALAKLLHFVPTARTGGEKQTMWNQLVANRAEGFAVKDGNAKYNGGRNGSHKKYKFETTASFLVGAKPANKANDGHRSIALYLDEGGKGFRFIATCKVADKYPIPPNGAIVEIRYLYAHKGGGISQPCYFGVVRTDVRVHECSVGQLKYKQDEAA